MFATPTLRDLREEADLSSDVVAAANGISGGHLRNVETADKVASPRLLRRLCRYYTVQLGRPIDLSDIAASDKPKEEKKHESGGSGSGPADNRPTTKPAKKSAA